MKKLLIWIVALFSFITVSQVWAISGDAKAVLQTRLAKLDGFYAQFEQIVKTQEGDLVQEGEGQLWISRPYYFNWTMTEPDELSIISDGDTVWLYTPMVEQVTAMSLNNITNNHLLLLITDSQGSIWDLYNVTQKNDEFNLIPVNQIGQHFEITVNPNGEITSFSTTEEDGQHSLYQLTDQKIGTIDKNKFKFVIPEGVTLDDQR